MKYADINKRFTELTTEYMSKGYIVNTSTMRGSQGEIAHIDLTDGNEIIRIFIQSFSDWRSDIEGVEIIIGKSTDGVKPHLNDTWGTVWNSHLEILHTERFYAIGRHKDYYVTKEEAESASSLRRERRINRYESPNTFEANAKVMQIAKSIVRNKIGYKRINESEVNICKRNNQYIVSYRGNTYALR